MTEARHYRAFISYSHSDEHWARWLQRALEKYKLPKTFRKSHPELPNRLYPIFRDRDELASAHDLSESIRKAMDDSDALIVICSPAARNSHWVNEEIRRFKASDRGQRIFCFLVAGSPDPKSTECAFPPALLLDDDGQSLHEPLAADATPQGDGKRNAMLKIAAGLLGVGVDDLKQRDAQRQARFWSSVALGTTLIAAITIGMAIYAFKAKKESELRRQQAEGLIGFMLGDLRDKLEPIGKLELLDAVGDQAMGYFNTLGDRGSPKEMLSRAVALKQIGDVRFQQGKLEPALLSFEQALKQTQALYESDTSNNSYLFELSQAEFWVGAVAFERGKLERAEKAFQNYMLYSQELLRREPKNPDYVLELGYAYSNLGSAAKARGDSKSALKYFELCREIDLKLISADTEDFDLVINSAETLSWIGSTKRILGDLPGSDKAFDTLTKDLLPLHNKKASARASFTLAANMVHQSLTKANLGQIDNARKLNIDAITILAKLTEQDPQNADWLRTYINAQFNLLSMIPHAEWNTENDAELKQFTGRLLGLLKQDPSNRNYIQTLVDIEREQALRALYAGNFHSARIFAQSAFNRTKNELTKSPSLPDNIVKHALSAEILGQALMAGNEKSKAELLWNDAARELDAQSAVYFDFYPVRRLLAINLGETAKSEETNALLANSNFNDPRMQTDHALSGKFAK